MKDENLSPIDERVTRCIDGASSESERRELELDPAAQGRDLAKKSPTRRRSARFCVSTFPALSSHRSPTFSIHKSCRKIREETAVARRSVEVGGGDDGRLAAFALADRGGGGGCSGGDWCHDLGRKSERTQVLSVYSPEPNATAHTWYSREAHAVIIDVEGLPTYPADRQIAAAEQSEPRSRPRACRSPHTRRLARHRPVKLRFAHKPGIHGGARRRPGRNELESFSSAITASCARRVLVAFIAAVTLLAQPACADEPSPGTLTGLMCYATDTDGADVAEKINDTAGDLAAHRTRASHVVSGKELFPPRQAHRPGLEQIQHLAQAESAVSPPN